MKRRLRGPALLTVFLLAACGTARPPASTSLAGQPGVCRVGPDGGPLALPGQRADRGIGGTGIKVADRGIGGTGARVADRGIGGTGAPATGILGVITGFASVCLAGEEVQYAADIPVHIDNAPGRLDQLRAGQVAAITAAGPAPYAVSVVVRHEVSGPVDGPDSAGLLRVAGQAVLPPLDASSPTPGTWVSVSGFRRLDGVVAATRLDSRPPGEVLVRGVMVPSGGRLWIGTVEIRPGPGQVRRPGVPVTAIGHLRDGVLAADTVEPDALVADPDAFFGTPGVLIVQGYAEGGVVVFGGRRFGAPVPPGLATLRLERNGAGQFDPVSVRPSGMGGMGAAPRPGLQPAPVPNRAAGAGPASGPGGNRGYGDANRRRGDGRDSADGPDGRGRGGFGGGGGAGGLGGGRGR